MAPDVCVAMDAGAQVIFEGGRRTAARAARFDETGAMDAEWRG
jgi:hypothetical protein